MIVVLDIPDPAVAGRVLAALPDESVAWGGDFRDLQAAADALVAEAARRRPEGTTDAS